MELHGQMVGDNANSETMANERSLVRVDVVRWRETMTIVSSRDIPSLPFTKNA